MALAANPEVLILDEPTTALDATVEAEVLDLIQALQGEIDAAILLISHDVRVVAKLCDRVGMLYAGRLLEEGPAEDVVRAPRHPYTLALLRCVPRLDADGAPSIWSRFRAAHPIWAPSSRLLVRRALSDRPSPLPRGGAAGCAARSRWTSRCHYHGGR